MTDPQTNPLIVAGKQRQSTTWNLEDYCAWLNSLHFVHDSGAPFAIGQRTKHTGEVERFLDRRTTAKAD